VGHQLNPKQQGDHRKVTHSLDARLNDLETVVAAALPALKRTDVALETRIASAEQCCEDRGQAATNAHRAHTGQSFWQRLSWLVLGK
jgi:hypothetical protein